MERRIGQPPTLSRIGLLGGTFDPPHLGHLQLAQTAIEQLQLDRLLVIPAGQPPHKANKPVTAAHHRVAMTLCAFANQPHCDLDQTDVDRPPPHYSATLLPLLETKYPNAQLWLIVGSDSIRDFLTWHEPEIVLKHCRLAVLPRPAVTIEWTQLDVALPQLRHKIDWLDAPPLDITSTRLRSGTQPQMVAAQQLSPTVSAYINAHQLYNS